MTGRNGCQIPRWTVFRFFVALRRLKKEAQVLRWITLNINMLRFLFLATLGALSPSISVPSHPFQIFYPRSNIQTTGNVLPELVIPLEGVHRQKMADHLES